MVVQSRQATTGHCQTIFSIRELYVAIRNTNKQIQQIASPKTTTNNTELNWWPGNCLCCNFRTAKRISPCKRCEKPGYALNQSYSLYNDTNAFCSCCRWSGLLNQSKKNKPDQLHENHERNRYDCENNRLNGQNNGLSPFISFYFFLYLVIIFVNSCQ